MILPDAVNGVYELGGSLLLWLSVRKLYREKLVRGVHVIPTTFFWSWGVWNLYYYPHLGQWLSFIGGLSMVVANGVWAGQMFYYNWRERQ